MDSLGGTAIIDAAVEAELLAARAARDALDYADALAIYQSILAQDPQRGEALAGKGAILRLTGQLRDAVATLTHALDLDHRNIDARLELALTLQGLGRSDEARALSTALIRAPFPPARAWQGLALLLLGDGHDAAAETALRRAIAQAPGLIEARQTLADLLARRLDLRTAIDLYHGILAMDPDNSQALSGLGQALIGLGRMDEAQDQLERSLALKPDQAQAHLGRARLNLLDGHLQGAWDDLEWRWQAHGRPRPTPPGESWNGDDLTGKTLLLWAEQGISETLHLLRYVPRLVHRAAKVVLGLPRPLLGLAKGIEGVHAAIASGQALPAGMTIDVNASLGDLPRLFGTSLAGIPRPPYMGVPAGHRVPVSAPPTAVLKVGLCWAGPRGAWNIPFTALMPLMGLPGIAFFGLQTGRAAADCTTLAHPALITDLSPSIADYADLAGRIGEMDLIISVDSPVAHLAAALGKAVWVLLDAAPDWRWMRDGDETPWYPSARLFRQQADDGWDGVVAQVTAALGRHADDQRLARQGVAHGQSGRRAAQRAMLSTHLTPGDVLVDVGSGSAAPHVLDAAYLGLDDLAILAIDARSGEAALLEDTLAIAGLSDVVEVIHATIGAAPAPVAVARRKRGGRAVFTLPPWVSAATHSTPLSDIIAARPHLAGRRLVLRLGALGEEAAIIAGLGDLRPAMVVLTASGDDQPLGMLRQMGYGLFAFPTDSAAGSLAPLDTAVAAGTVVLALSDGQELAPLYGDAGDPTSPASMGKVAVMATHLAKRGNAALLAGKVNEAAADYARALALDVDNVDANINLGRLLRRSGRADAAGACWRRALARGAPAATLGALAGALHDGNRLAEAEQVFAQALAQAPNDPRILVAAALLHRDLGRPRAALDLLERAESLRPGSVPGLQMAVTLLKSGNLARGMAEMARRPPAALSRVNAPDWDGSRLQARTILIRDEGNAIDTLMLARYIPLVALQGGLVQVECVPDLAPFLEGLAGVEGVIARGQPLPAVECQTRLLDVPRLLGTTSRTTPPRNVPYLSLPEGAIAFRFPGLDRLHVGVSWIGPRRQDRGVPLPVLMRLAAHPQVDFISLQRGERAAELNATGTRLFVEDMGSQCGSLVDVAALIAGLDLIITADTVEAHLAAAMGKPVWVLLPLGNDWRWVDEREDSVWYPTMRVFRQAVDGTWDHAMARLSEALAAMAAGKQARGG